MKQRRNPKEVEIKNFINNPCNNMEQRLKSKEVEIKNFTNNPCNNIKHIFNSIISNNDSIKNTNTFSIAISEGVNPQTSIDYFSKIIQNKTLIEVLFFFMSIPGTRFCGLNSPGISIKDCYNNCEIFCNNIFDLISKKNIGYYTKLDFNIISIINSCFFGVNSTYYMIYESTEEINTPIVISKTNLISFNIRY